MVRLQGRAGQPPPRLDLGERDRLRPGRVKAPGRVEVEEGGPERPAGLGDRRAPAGREVALQRLDKLAAQSVERGVMTAPP